MGVMVGGGLSRGSSIGCRRSSASVVDDVMFVHANAVAMSQTYVPAGLA